MSEAIACPGCFNNFGFKQTITMLCRETDGKCVQCGQSGFLKIDHNGLKQAIYNFFVEGSLIAGTYQAAYQVNLLNPSPASFDPTLAPDTELACRLTGLVVFDYGPPLWRVGETEVRNQFEAGGALRRGAAEDLIEGGKMLKLPAGSRVFRMRLNPKLNEAISLAVAFDPPPATFRRTLGRWDDLDHPVLYVSDDIELCLHECRATISDEIVVASLSPTRDLRLLDLSGEIEWTGGTPFEDPNVFIGMMSRSRGRWLEYCREISRTAHEAGYDGIRYVSYYAQAKHNTRSLNLAIFGHPIKDGMFILESVNRIRISDMVYKFRLGPLFQI